MLDQPNNKKTPLVEMQDISVSFGGVKAVADASQHYCTQGAQ